MTLQGNQKICLLISIALFLGACTKPREASLPDSQIDYVFSINDFGPVMGLDSSYSIQTSSQKVKQTESDAVRAEYEIGKVSVKSAKVPKNLTFMFKDLFISGEAGAVYPITFLVDRKNVTAYKIVKDLKNLSTLEKQYARTYEAVRYQEIALKSKDRQQKESALFELRRIEQNRLNGQLSGAAFLIPIFKYTVQSYGVLERAKNMLKEETSVLEMKSKDWEDSTHIMIAITKDSALPVTVAEYDKQDLDRTFLVSSLQNQVMTASDLAQKFQVKVDLPENSQVQTLLDDSGLNIFEITSEDKLSETEKRALRQGVPSNEIRRCSSDLAEKSTDAKSCVRIHRFAAPINFVALKSQNTSIYGEAASQLYFEKTNFARNEGLLMIPKFVEPARVVKDLILDSSAVLKISELKNKEFFFRRTLQDVPGSSLIPAGLASAVIPVRFEFAEDRVILRKTMINVEFQSGLNKSDREEVMSFPVTYFREEKVDSKGAPLAFPRIEKTQLSRAQFLQIDWTQNTLAPTYSPLTYFSGYGSCITGIGNLVTESLDNRLEKGVLNFTQSYSLSLRPSLECISVVRGINDFSMDPIKYQQNINVKERISLVYNDGRTDEKFGLNIPFDMQRRFHFGLFTNSKHAPDKNGLTHREGTVDLSSIRHDFRNGRILKYHVLGLPKDNPELREILTEVVEETVASWNLAYRNAFKGTSLERSGVYIEYEFAQDEQSVQLGDLDKHIIYLDPKTYVASGFLGITQVGFNPRSSVVVADSLILYVGNIVRWEAFENNSRQTIARVEQQKADMLKNAAAKKPAQTSGSALQLNIAQNITSHVLQGQPVKASAQYLGKNLARNEAQKSTFLREKSQLISAQGLKKFDITGYVNDEQFMLSTLRQIKNAGGIDRVNLQSVVAEEMLKNYGKKLSSESQMALQVEAARAKAIHDLTGKVSAQGGCLSTTPHLSYDSGQKLDARQLLKRALGTTLAHEIGHSQGLTHNFIGSADKANYNRAGENSPRNYSSVMDYMNTMDQNYDGIGPYDIHALRISHTGLAEAQENSKKLAQSEYKTALVGNEVNLIEIDRIVQKNGGWSKAPLQLFNGISKKYLYCADIHVWYEPTCQRNDAGSSASEIVDSLIKAYNDHYIANYSRADKLSYSFSTASSTLAMTFHYLISIRQFTDEFAFKTLTGQVSEETFEDYKNATIKAINFFNSLALTETGAVSASDLGRFRIQKVKAPAPVLDEKGNLRFGPDGSVLVDESEKVILVEVKPLRPILSGESQIDSLGIMQDKLMALDMLTMQGFPHYKYNMANLNFSPLDIERQFLAPDDLPVQNLISIRTLGQTIAGKAGSVVMVNPMTLIPTGKVIEEDMTMSIYASLMSIFNLETPSIKVEENFANLFKVGSSLGKPVQDRVSIGRTDIADDSSSKLHFWPLDRSLFSQGMIEMQLAQNSLTDLTTASKMGLEVKALVDAFLEVMASSALQPIAEARTNEDEKIIFKNHLEQIKVQGQRNVTVAQQKLFQKVAALAKSDEAMKRIGIQSQEHIQQMTSDVYGLVATLVEANMLTTVALQLMPANAQQSPLQASQKKFEEIVDLTSEVPYLSGIIKRLPLWIEAAAEKQKMKLESEAEKLSATEKNALTLRANLIVGASQVAAKRSQILPADRDQAVLLRKLDFLNKLSIVTNPELNR